MIVVLFPSQDELSQDSDHHGFVTVHEDASPSPQPAVSPSPSPAPQNQGPQSQRDQDSIEAIQAQQEAFRALLRQAVPEGAQEQQVNDTEDPAAKFLSSLLDGVPGDPNVPPGAAPAAPPVAPSKLASIATSLGVPPFLANLLGGAFSEPQEDPKSVRLWKTLHVVFALGLAIYVVFLVGTSVSLFGFPPPKPATAQNPFAIFLTGELLLISGRVLLGGPLGLRSGLNLIRGAIGDGMLVIFVLGLATWYTRGWQDVAPLA